MKESSVVVDPNEAVPTTNTMNPIRIKRAPRSTSAMPKVSQAGSIIGAYWLSNLVDGVPGLASLDSCADVPRSFVPHFAQ